MAVTIGGSLTSFVAQRGNAGEGSTSERDVRVLIVLGSDAPGAFGFTALALDYRIGPLTFHTIHHLALDGCLGPLPAGTTCPGNG